MSAYPNASNRERGQALPLMLVALVVAAAAMMALAALAQRAADDARARTAADAAALAGAAEGRAGANALANANGVELVEYAESGPHVRVTVSVGERRAVAVAERVSPPPPVAGGPTAGLTPEMLAAIGRAEALLGQTLPIVSGWRSPDEQAWLWAHRATNPYPVARPGTSMHERGLAIDVAGWFVDTLRSVAVQARLCHPLPETDPVHFVLC